jgi:protein kinase N
MANNEVTSSSSSASSASQTIIPTNTSSGRFSNSKSYYKTGCTNNGGVSLIHYDQSCQQVFTNDYFEELVEKYSLPFDPNDLEQLNLNQKLEEIKQFLKNEIFKQYKLQEGADKMRCAATAGSNGSNNSDKKLLSNLSKVITESNMKIDELNQELLDLNSFIVITQSESSVITLDSINTNNECDSPELGSFSNGSSGRPSAENASNVQQYRISGVSMHETPHEQRIRMLNRQLEIEQKIKVGAENMLHSFSQGLKKDKKLSEDASAMLKDAKLKIEYIKMQLNKVNSQYNETISSSMYGQHKNNVSDNLSNKLEVLMPVELRIEELRHRLHIESAVCEGAKNAVNVIQSQKNEKKALQQAQMKLNESLDRISLLNLSWQRILKSLPSRSNYEKGTNIFANGEMPRAAPITGQLEVRLMGCQDLLENVPER